jgi:hypothetical protein
MPDYFETDPIGSERLLGKVITGGTRMKHRHRVLTRSCVAGFVAVLAAGGALGATQAGKPSQSSANQGSRLAPQFTQLDPVRTVASSSLRADPPGNVDDNDTTTFWAADSRVAIVVRVPNTKVVEQVGPNGSRHKVTVHGFFLKHELSHPGVGSWIKLVYTTKEPIRAIGIIPGDHFPRSQFNRFGRPANVEAIFSSGPPVFFTVPNSPNFFHLTFFPARESSFVELKVLSTYAGTKKHGQFDAITELAAYTESYGTTGSSGTSTTPAPPTTFTTTIP